MAEKLERLVAMIPRDLMKALRAKAQAEDPPHGQHRAGGAPGPFAGEPEGALTREL
jgi:hypothetical protein